MKVHIIYIDSPVSTCETMGQNCKISAIIARLPLDKVRLAYLMIVISLGGANGTLIQHTLSFV